MTSTRCFFRVGHRTLSTRRLSGQFPNYEAVMPRDNTKFAVVRSSELSAAIQRVAQFADERSGAIRMRLEGNELKISSQFDGIRRERRHDRYALRRRSHRGGLQFVVHHRLPQGAGQRRRSPPGVQGLAIRRPDAPRGPRRRIQVALCADADADLKNLTEATRRPGSNAGPSCLRLVADKRGVDAESDRGVIRWRRISDQRSNCLLVRY